jgi:hypothetical protein
MVATSSRVGKSGRACSVCAFISLGFYFNERHKREWMTDGSLDLLWPAAERAGVPVALAAARSKAPA